MTAVDRLSSIRAHHEYATNVYAAPNTRRDARLKLEREDVPAMVDALTRVLELPHGPVGPWDDDLVRWDAVVAAIEAALSPAQGTPA